MHLDGRTLLTPKTQPYTKNGMRLIWFTLIVVYLAAVPVAMSPAKTAGDHPSYNDMITDAIAMLKDRGGSSLIAIKKAIAAKYKLKEGWEKKVTLYIRRMSEKGQLSKVKASYKLSADLKDAKKKSAKKAAKPVKPAATKAVKKTAKPVASKEGASADEPKAEKPKADKSKAAKPKAKKAKTEKPKAQKAVAKKPAAKKAVAKKTAAKPAAKKAASKTKASKPKPKAALKPKKTTATKKSKPAKK
jgi:histone H1/5